MNVIDEKINIFFIIKKHKNYKKILINKAK